MAETCENCGNPLADWGATHCSEYCLLEEIKSSKTVYNHSDFDMILAKMRMDTPYHISA